MTCTIDGSKATKYLNGATFEDHFSGAGGSAQYGGNPATLPHGISPDSGTFKFGASNVEGRMDELRVRDGVASAEWIAADYAQQFVDDFLSYVEVADETFTVLPIPDQTVSSIEELLAGVMPSVTVSNITDGVELVPDTEYTVTYTGNKSIGVAYAVVAGRGELQLGVLIETMRREGFELSISRPRVLMKKDENGQLLEPVEEVVVDVDEEFSGAVVEKLGRRRGELIEMIPSQVGNKTRLIFNAPSRGLIGYHSEFLTDTRGTGVMNRLFKCYEPYKGEIESRRTGVLISSETGTAIAYSLWKLQERGPMFIDPGDPVYTGMIIGEHTKPNDIEVNPCKAKQLTNIRAAGKDEAIDLIPPRKMSLEQGLSYIQDDELLEVTPKSLRLRKRILDPLARKRAKPEVIA